MEIFWTLKAQDDLARIYRFALQYSRQHADHVLDRLLTGSADLKSWPSLGVQQIRYVPREVRKVVIDDYEIHYEIKSSSIYIVALWHTREDR